MQARIQKRFITKYTDSEFRATYKGHTVYVYYEPKGGAFRPFYIMVTAPSGLYAYDGWWGEPWSTMNEAITQALIGSCLIPRGSVVNIPTKKDAKVDFQDVRRATLVIEEPAE